ncbi:MAG: AAA family ATPase [Clostridia bacterium]|nr:AAA family ATPase [Clostridia bacterium]
MTAEMKLKRMSEIELQEVEWLWYPYIPFGKITIIQGDPGEGKTTLGLRLAAACSNGSGFPGMEEREPISVIYQTAEDGLGDTVKPRLIEAEANENLIFNISEDTDVLTLKDERIAEAIRTTGARLMIFDPIQGYVGEDTDINRANEIRTVMRGIANVAEKSGCAIVFVGHLNKMKGTNSAYRGLGTIDFRASARSVLLVGRLRKFPNVRVIVHDKSSLAPEGKSMAFNLGNDEGFRWIDGYDSITADELLCGGTNETKTGAAEDLIRDMLSSGEYVPSERIYERAKEKDISPRTVTEAKAKIKGITTKKIGKAWHWAILENADCTE